MVPQVGDADASSGTLAWLLDPSNPSARYLTLTRILGRAEDAPEVGASRAAIAETAPARDILSAQYPQGYWMHPGIGYSPRYRATIWQILILAQLGMARCPALDRAVGHLFEANQREDGAFCASREPGDTPLGLNGSLLWALDTLGYGDAPQVDRAWSWLAHELETRRSEVESGGLWPRWAAVKALWAANAVSSRPSSDAVSLVSRAASLSLLHAAPEPDQVVDPRWFRLTFPLTEAGDLLQWLEVLTDAGYGGDPRLAPAREWLAGKRRADDTWPLERSPGKLWADMGEPGEPNKWITIRALAVDR